MYIFTTDKQVQGLFVNGTHSGSMAINEAIMQYCGKKFVNSYTPNTTQTSVALYL